jgi:crotonobetainyl-CoA:carnitine CoA-transferase CaiB-like acyl-CoA transferase
MVDRIAPMVSALAGRRVLELADESGAYCGKLLADMGADVVKIEPPGGEKSRWIPPFRGDDPSPLNSLSFLYANTNKRSVTLDLTQHEGVERLRRLAATADVVLETFPPGTLEALGLGYEDLRRDNPGLVVTSITGFGQTGPQRNFKSCDLIANALGGSMYVTGFESEPPVTLAGSQAYRMASTCAAASTLIALYWRDAGGHGQHVDISIQETMLAVTHICGVGKWLDDGIIPRRGGTGLFASVPSGAYPCKDGLIYVMVNRPLHWQALAHWISEVTGNDAVLDPIFEGPSSSRFADRDLLDYYISDLTARFTVEEVYHEGQRRHLAVTPVNRIAAVVRDPQLAARNFFVHVDGLTYPGAPYRHSLTPWTLRRPAPAVGEHNDEILGVGSWGLGVRGPDPIRGPRPLIPNPAPGLRTPTPTSSALADVRVLEFTAGMAGPWIGRFMAYCGAEVIKVESRKRPDVTRQYVPPWAPEMGIQEQLSPWLTDWNAGKRFVSLDLTKPQAVELALRLVSKCDVVVENYRAGVMEKLGLGYAAMRAVKEDVILFSTAGYGDTGPYSSYVTWGPNIEAMAGLSTLTGFSQHECTMTQYAYPDALSALHGLFAVMCALDHRRRSGEGQYVNLSQLEASVAVIGDEIMEYLVNDRAPQKLGNRSRYAAPHGCYRCLGEDRWCAIAVFDDEEWKRLCAVVGQPDWIEDARFATLDDRLANVDTLDRMIEDWTGMRDAYDVMSTLQAAGVAAGVVQTVEDQYRHDPQLAARHFFEEIEHLVKGKVVAPGIPLGLTATPGRTRNAGASVGEDNQYVFGELLGLSEAEIRECSEAGAIETDDPGSLLDP